MDPVASLDDSGARVAKSSHVRPTNLGFGLGHQHAASAKAHFGRRQLLLLHHLMRAGLARHRREGVVPPRQNPHDDEGGRPKGVLFEPGQRLD